MQYPLKQFGIETGPVTFSSAPLNASDYVFEAGRTYEVIESGGDLRRRIGLCTVEGSPGRFTVEPDFELDGGGEFWAVWVVDDGGIARLERVVLVKRDA